MFTYVLSTSIHLWRLTSLPRLRVRTLVHNLVPFCFFFFQCNVIFTKWKLLKKGARALETRGFLRMLSLHTKHVVAANWAMKPHVGNQSIKRPLIRRSVRSFSFFLLFCISDFGPLWFWFSVPYGTKFLICGS